MSHTNARRYLLAGLATCGECGLPLRGRPTYRAKASKGPRPRAYVCQSGAHVHRPVEQVDAVVTARVVERLARLSDLGVFTDDAALGRITDLEQALQGIAGRRDSARRRWAAGKVSDADYDRDLDALQETEQALTSELGEARAALRPHAVLEGVTGSQLAAERFHSLPLGRQRAIIAHLFDQVTLNKAEHSRARFSPDDVVTDWSDLTA